LSLVFITFPYKRSAQTQANQSIDFALAAAWCASAAGWPNKTALILRQIIEYKINSF